ncbi:MAG TPA: IPT/TIG domain-containing protein, partial [Mycobacteriales bacterium]|nr:IPT/TIG domain-containing protein [Mycobacteriales bacterium]
VSPSSGSTKGGTTVTVTGSGFTGATAVTFGATAATSYTVVSDTQITVVSPAHSAGTVNVSVTSPYGKSGVVAADHFTYVSG